MSCEFRIFRHFVTIFRNLMIFKMSYLFNQVRVSKNFFTFKFFSEYSFKIANLLWHKLKLIFCCQSYDVIFAPKTVKIKNLKTYDCWEYKVLLPCKVLAQTVKNWKSRLKMFTFWWQLTRRGLSLFFVTCRSDLSARSVYIHITPPEICQIPSHLSNFHEGKCMLRRFFKKNSFSD